MQEKKKEKDLLIISNKDTKVVQKYLIAIYDENICKIENEKEHTLNDQYKLTLMENAIDENPLYAHYLLRIITYKVNIRNLRMKKQDIENSENASQEELDEAKAIFTTKIPNIQKKLKPLLKQFNRISERDEIDLEELDLDMVVSEGVRYGCNGDIDLLESIKLIMLRDNIVVDKKNEQIILLTGRLNTIKNLKWYQLKKKYEIFDEYNFIRRLQ